MAFQGLGPSQTYGEKVTTAHKRAYCKSTVRLYMVDQAAGIKSVAFRVRYLFYFGRLIVSVKLKRVHKEDSGTNGLSGFQTNECISTAEMQSLVCLHVSWSPNRTNQTVRATVALLPGPLSPTSAKAWQYNFITPLRICRHPLRS